MRDIEIYVEGNRLDLFDNGTIEIKSSIQDAKDISKVFTDYSQPFTIPASDNNNKIFRHHYKTDITDNVFDGRVRHEAKIFINHLLFKRGKVFLNGTSMKNGKANSYKITFFGNTVSLKDKFKDLTLSSLDLSAFDLDFSRNNVQSLFVNGKTVNNDDSALIFPLITSKKRLFYDSSLSNTSNNNFNGNLYYPPTVPEDIRPYSLRGVNESDLKPAIKIYHIIKAIEAKFDLVLIPNDNAGTKDFLSIQNEAISNLYLWLSNGSGSITSDNEGDKYFYSGIPTEFGLHANSDEDFVWLSESNGEFTIKGGTSGAGRKDAFANSTLNSYLAFDFDFKIHIRPSGIYQHVNWMVRFVNKKTNSYQTIKGSGDKLSLITIPYDLEEDQVYYIEFYSESPMIETEIIFEAREDNGEFFWWQQPSDFEMYTTKFGSNQGFNTSSSRLSVKNEMPDMKIMDFIAGLFKTFNLTAYVIDDETDSEYGEDSNEVPNVIKITTLDDYYLDSVNNQSKGIIDVTKYIDIRAHNVDTSLPFSEIDFKYEDDDTLLKSNHLNTFGEEFGNSSLLVSEQYPDVDLFFGEKYEIESPFTILKYERIEGTNIQWGYAAGGDFSSTRGDFSSPSNPIMPTGDYTSKNIKPLLFYGIKETPDTEFSFGSESGTQLTGISSGYYRPSNTNETVVVDGGGAFTTPAAFSLTFDAEIDEFTLTDFGASSNSLFNKFYKTYIKSVFDANKRIFKFKAYLPPSFLINYKLNDQLKVQDVVYRINSITTNLNTGLSQLELINLNVEEIVE